MSYRNLNTFMEKRAGVNTARKIGKTLTNTDENIIRQYNKIKRLGATKAGLLGGNLGGQRRDQDLMIRQLIERGVLRMPT